jgi:hypothetical protein
MDNPAVVEIMEAGDEAHNHSRFPGIGPERRWIIPTNPLEHLFE